MEKRCINCGRMIEKGAQVCQHCGAAQGGAFEEWNDTDVIEIDPIGDEEKAKNIETKKKQVQNIATAVAWVCMLVIVAFVIAYMWKMRIQ